MTQIIQFGCVGVLCSMMASNYPSVFLVSDAFAIDSSLDNPDFGSETIDVTKRGQSERRKA